MARKHWKTLFVTACLMMLSASAETAEYQEAPAFAEQVKAGALPPVEERLPENPLVVQPHSEIGRYGGVWRMGMRGSGDRALLLRTINYEQLMRWDLGFREPVPNLAEAVDVNADATVFTITLRKGLKWSDGEPFTVDDILYWYELHTREKLDRGLPGFLKVGGEVVRMEKKNAQTIVFSFAAPYGLFLHNLAQPELHTMTSLPKHIVSQYDPLYNENAEELAPSMGFDSADELLLSILEWGGRWDYQLPSLCAWQLTNPLRNATSQLVAERNPYYWKVDPEGRQLPYIDTVIFNAGDELDSLVLQAMVGEIDMQSRHLNVPAHKPLLEEAMEDGGYRFFELVSTLSNSMAISLNLTHADPVKRSIFQNRDFRAGLSHAINRQEIIDNVYGGRGKPHQVAPLPDSELYNARLATQYLEYSEPMAHEFLDKAGYSETDAEGFRLGPDGERISITIEVVDVKADMQEAVTLIVESWKKVGIDARMQAEDRAIFSERKESNQSDATVWDAAGGLGLTSMLDPRYFVPYSHSSDYAPLWYQWHAGMESGEEPPDTVKKQLRLYEQLKSTAERREQDSLMREILQIAADQFYAIGIGTAAPGFGVVSQNMRNVPESMFASWMWPNPGPSNPEQYFYAQ